jgi:hypothetical protein
LTIIISDPSGLDYKHVTVVNDDSSVINKFEASLTDDARVVIYDRHIFMVRPLYYKHHMGVNDASRIIIDNSRVTLQIVASFTDDSRSIIDDCNMLIVQGMMTVSAKAATILLRDSSNPPI